MSLILLPIPICFRSTEEEEEEADESMELLLFSVKSLFLSSLVPFVVFLFFYHQNQAKKPSPPTGLKPYPFLGTVPHFIRNRHRFLEWTTEILARGPTHTMTMRSPTDVNGIITADPRNVEHLLKTNFANFPKGDRSISLLQDFLGHGIFNSDGENWKQQRKTASFEFNKRSLRNFVMDTVHDEITARLLPLLSEAAIKNEVVELQDVLERFGFDNICKVAFGEDPACLSDQGKKGSDFMKAFGDAQNLIIARFMGSLGFEWRIKKLLDVGSEKKLRESISIVHDFAVKIIKSKKERSEELKEEDLLSRFALNEDINTDELLRDTVINFIIAGRETTSSALTWFFWVLSSRPEVEIRILEEVRSIRATQQNKHETFTFDELREMNYLHAAISESLRLYPPVPIDTQSCRDGDVMPDGTFVGKGWFVTYSAYAMGRMESVWGEDCVEYRPERWLEDGVFRPESPYRFPVFHAGPRMCLGKEMAYIQMKSIVASVLERFKIEVVEGSRTPEPLLSLTMRMKGGLPVRVRDRSRCVDA